MKIIVHDQEDYDLLVKASEQLHSGDVDTDNPIIHLLTHLYRVNTEDANCEKEKEMWASMIEIDPSVPKIWREE